MVKTVSLIKEGCETAYYEIQDIIEYLVDSNDDFVCTACLSAIDSLKAVSEKLLDK